MTKKRIMYVCNKCGAQYPKWSGKCENCNQWNSLEEDDSELAGFLKTRSSSNKNNKAGVELHDLSDVRSSDIIERIDTKNSEFNRVVGGGLVPGSAILIGGDPGIGKSTLLLQIASNMPRSLYVSGEESVEQIQLRAHRIGISGKEKSGNVKLAANTVLSSIIDAIKKCNDVNIVIIDSIQTIYHEDMPSAPGTVGQVRACSFELISLAKKKNICLIIIGHVTKDGQIAGPKVLEHMVDTVLYFEGERSNNHRIIRSIKNRFGAANEIGIFRMESSGLATVTNPSEIFLSETSDNISGSCIFAGIEGSRPILVEVQALIVPSFLATPRRAVIGWDANRLAMIIAVLKARLNINLLDKEVYLNIAGGLKIIEPAVDMAVISALISASNNTIIPKGLVLFGEVGLSGEVRSVQDQQMRIQEAENLGFNKIIIPNHKSREKRKNNIEICSVKNIKDLMKYISYE